jgi:hypothetical protein
MRDSSVHLPKHWTRSIRSLPINLSFELSRGKTLRTLSDSGWKGR